MNKEPATQQALPHDSDLLRRIAQEKDEAALATLLSRHEGALYSLALRVTHDPETAADAIQDAAFQIWRSAGSFRAPGNPRAWMMRIVARASLKHAHRQRAAKCLMADLDPDTLANQGSGELTERSELLACVGRRIKGLAPPDQRLLALYFCGGLSQQEIGCALQMPQRTVSKRLSTTVALLRQGLQDAGLAAAVPLLESGLLEEVLCAGPSARQGLVDRIMASLPRQDSAPRVSASNRPGGGRAPRRSAILAAAALAVLGSALLWQALKAETAPAAPVQPSQAVNAQGGAQVPEHTAGAGTRFSRSWDFNSPAAPLDIRVTSGGWTWVPGGGSDGSGCYETSKLFVAEIRVPLARFPCLFTYRNRVIQPNRVGEALNTVSWSDFNRAANLLNVGLPDHRESLADWIETSVFLTEQTSDCFTNGRRTRFSFQRRTPGAPPSFACREAVRLDDLAVREIPSSAAPADHGIFLEALHKLPAWPRSGKVPLPGLKSTRPGQPVYADFFSN